MKKWKYIENAMGFCVAVFFFLFCFWAFHSYFFLTGAMILIVLGIADVVNLYGTVRNVEIKLKGNKADCYKDIITGIFIEVKNNSFAFSQNMYLKLLVENEFYQEKKYHILNLPAEGKHYNITEFPVEFLNMGKIKIQLEEVKISSLLGIWEQKKQLKEELIFYVFPKEMGMGKEVERYDGIREQVEEREEEGRKKGYDFSEMMGIREYIPGDRMRDIHWKLSGKKDELMVIERANRSDVGEILLLELSEIHSDIKTKEKNKEEIHVLDDVLVTCFKFVRDTLQSGIPIELAMWNDSTGELQSFEINRVEEIPRAFMQVLDCVAYQELNKLEQFWKNTKTGGYLWAGTDMGNINNLQVIAKGENNAIIKKEES